jgi:hypothetical protein
MLRRFHKASEKSGLCTQKGISLDWIPCQEEHHYDRGNRQAYQLLSRAAERRTRHTSSAVMQQPQHSIITIPTSDASETFKLPIHRGLYMKQHSGVLRLSIVLRPGKRGASRGNSPIFMLSKHCFAAVCAATLQPQKSRALSADQLTSLPRCCATVG